MRKRFSGRRRFSRRKNVIWTRAATAASFAGGLGPIGINLVDPPDFMPIVGLDSNKGILYKGGRLLFTPHFAALVTVSGTLRLTWGVYVAYDSATTRDPRQTNAIDQEADWLALGSMSAALPVVGATTDFALFNENGGPFLSTRIATSRRLQTNQQIVFSFVAQADSGTLGVNLASSGWSLIDSELLTLRNL